MIHIYLLKYDKLFHQFSVDEDQEKNVMYTNKPIDINSTEELNDLIRNNKSIIRLRSKIRFKA